MYWEYLTLQIETKSLASELNSLTIPDKRRHEVTDRQQIQRAGPDEWNLISVIPLTKHGFTARSLCIFKRLV